MNERPGPTGRNLKTTRPQPATRATAPSSPPTTKPQKKVGLTYRQQRQILGGLVVAVGVVGLGLYWVWRTLTLPDLVPVLNLPTLSPAPASASAQVAAVVPSPTATPLAPQPATPTVARQAFLTQLPDGGAEFLTNAPTSAPITIADSSTVYFPYLNLVTVPTPTSEPQTFIIAPPQQSWPESLPGLTASKLGLHVVSNSDPDVLEFVRRAHPRVIKAVDEVGWLAEVKAASSATIALARFSGEQNADWPSTLDPETAAKTYIEKFLNQYRLNPQVDYWEGWSDFEGKTEADWQWYAKFEAARACQMQALSLRAAVGGVDNEALTEDVMQWFLPALEATRKCGGLLTLHVYNAPTLACSGALAEAPTLRYRVWYEKYLQPAGLGDVPLVISELGIRGPSTHCGDPGNLAQGWKSYTGWWVNQGLGADGLQAYLNMLQWYDSEIRADDYVWGATIFTAGAIGANDARQTFDVHDLLQPLTHYAVEQAPTPELPTGYP